MRWSIFWIATPAFLAFALPGIPMIPSENDLFFPMDEDLIDNEMYTLCESIAERASHCSPFKCGCVLHKLKELNRHEDYSEESKSRLILDIWGQDFLEDEHQGCINESLNIARQYHLIIPPQPIRPPDCRGALAHLQQCKVQDCENLVNGYIEHNQRHAYHNRSNIAVSIWSFHLPGREDRMPCYLASMNQVQAAGLSLVIQVESPLGGRAIAFL